MSRFAILATVFSRITHRAILLVFAILLSVLTTPVVFGQSSISSDNSAASVETGKELGYTTADIDLLSRSALTSDRWGARSNLADNGVTVDLRYTSFYQGLVSGTGNKDFNYGGKVDAFINLDSGKMGLWEGGGFRSHIEYSHGDLANIRTEPLSWTFMVFDPNDRTNDYLPGDLFTDGVNIALTGHHATTLAGRRTKYTFNALYSTAEGVDYSSVGGAVGRSTESGAYNFSFEFKHNLQEDGGQSDASWGFYLKAAIADGNPSYVQSSLIAGIGGKALFFGRPQDSFGFGAYYYDLSDVLEGVIDPSTNFRDEAAIEFFYSYAVTPWLHFGPDIQYVRPARGRFKNALVVGLRMQIRI